MMESMAKEDLAGYLGGDRVRCLECGTSFRALGPHLRQTHGIGVAEYKRAHGIPQRFGLVGTGTREALRANVLGTLERHGGPLDAEARAKGLAAIRTATRLHGRKTVRGSAAVEEFVTRMEEGRLGADVERDPDMPSYSWVLVCSKQDEALAARLAAIRPGWVS